MENLKSIKGKAEDGDINISIKAIRYIFLRFHWRFSARNRIIFPKYRIRYFSYSTLRSLAQA